MIDAETSAIAFRAFAVPCTLAGAAASVVLDREVEVYDQDGQIVGRMITADLLKADGGAAEYGQALVVGAETFTIGRKVADDGFVLTYEVHEQ